MNKILLSEAVWTIELLSASMPTTITKCLVDRALDELKTLAPLSPEKTTAQAHALSDLL